MALHRSVVLALLFPIAACAGGRGPTDAGPGQDAGGPAVDGGPVLPPGTTTLTLNVGPLPVTAGTQIVYCTNLHLTNDAPIQVIGFGSTQTQGGHHLILVWNNHDVPDSPPVECGQGEAINPRTGSMLYVSQISPDSQLFPSNVGMTLPPHASVMLQVHYIDATPNDLMVSSAVNLYVGAPGSVTIPAAPLIFYDQTLKVPPGASSSTSSCIIQSDGPLDMFMLAGHMHSHGTNFTLDFTDLDGGTQQIYQTNSWDSPIEKDFSPPLRAQPGTTFTWSCSYENSDAGTIDQPDEMCAVLGSYYPAPQGSLFCATYGAGCLCFNGGAPDAG